MDPVSGVVMSHFRWCSDVCASRTSCTPAACVQPCLQPVCPCQGNGQQPPALLMSFWSPSPVPQLQCDVTKVMTKKQYFWKSLGCECWALCCLRWSCLKIPHLFHWGLACQQSVQITAFCHKKDLDDKINTVMPNYRSLQAGSKSLIGCSFPVLAFLRCLF